MNEFDAYKIYLAFKLHFTSEKYDITKTKGAVKFKKESFYKRQDQLSFQRLAEEFTDDTLPKFLIANHIDGNIFQHKSAGLVRTCRKIAEGFVFIPKEVWNKDSKL